MNIVKRVLEIIPDIDSHSIFRLSIRDKEMADGAYMDWIRDGHVHPLTHTYCMELLKVMSDIVQEAVKATGKTSCELFEEAYKASAKTDPSVDYHNWRWAHSIWHRSGIVTKTIELYCTELLEGEQLPLDFAGDYDHLTEAFK